MPLRCVQRPPSRARPLPRRSSDKGERASGSHPVDKVDDPKRPGRTDGLRQLPQSAQLGLERPLPVQGGKTGGPLPALPPVADAEKFACNDDRMSMDRVLECSRLCFGNRDDLINTKSIPHVKEGESHMKHKVLVIVLLLVVFSSIGIASTFGTKKRMPRPEEFGNVVINNYSEKNNIAPVVFKHWVHRARYTCRVCHVDLGFAMEAGGSDIKEADNLNHLYCGSCHNGKEAFGATSPREARERGAELRTVPFLRQGSEVQV